jgi:hypothetical protein
MNRTAYHEAGYVLRCGVVGCPVPKTSRKQAVEGNGNRRLPPSYGDLIEIAVSESQ